MRFWRGMAAALSLAAVLGAGTARSQEKSLYQRLGGYDAIAAVADEFIGRLASDEQEKRFFAGFSNDSKAHIRQLFVDLVCKVTGGPCAYIGRDMKTTHAGIGITKADWSEVANRLQESYRTLKAALATSAPSGTS